MVMILLLEETQLMRKFRSLRGNFLLLTTKSSTIYCDCEEWLLLLFIILLGISIAQYACILKKSRIVSLVARWHQKKSLKYLEVLLLMSYIKIENEIFLYSLQKQFDTLPNIP